MTFDSPTLGDAAGLAALAASVIGIAYGVRREIIARATMDARFEVSERTVAAAVAKSELLDRQLNDHKLDVAKRYVGVDALEKVESRLFAALDGVTTAIRDLGSRLDRAFEQHARN